ncbi:kynurenine formamidase isoform X2 [Diachasma alloeum]|uniref:kynurenine formamidase isoform X2 n=1 Tax=Diachasma alloeum TaxID=454923 RepID=UPI0007383230|nr:kynurenine formamidase isoform X2 [Diachasma alloeum]
MSIDPEYEREYSPSAWSKRYGNMEVQSKFLQLAHKVTSEMRKKIPCQLDIPYGSSDRMKYDIYGTDLPNGTPVFVFIHGGYWQECSKEFAGFGISALVAEGIKVINVGYDLCPTVKLSDVVTQIKIVTEEILKLCKKNGAKCVWLGGHSAGAHLAASLLHDLEWRTLMTERNLFQSLKGLVLIGGIYTLRPLLKTSYNGPLQLTEDEIQKFSFNDVDTRKLPPVEGIKVIVAVGECDAPKFIEESRHYTQQLLNFVDRVEYILLRNNIDHFDIVENLPDPRFLLTKSIIDNIKQ